MAYRTKEEHEKFRQEVLNSVRKYMDEAETWSCSMTRNAFVGDGIDGNTYRIRGNTIKIEIIINLPDDGRRRHAMNAKCKTIREEFIHG